MIVDMYLPAGYSDKNDRYPVLVTCQSQFLHVSGITVDLAWKNGAPELIVASVRNHSSGLTGPYLGQKPPGLEPVLFAPGFINTGIHTREVAMTPDGKEFYFCVSVGNSWNTLLVTREVDGRWSEPEVAPHMEDPNILNYEPCISPDGKISSLCPAAFFPGRNGRAH